MTGHACLQSTSYFFPALTLLTFWVTFCVNFHLTNTTRGCKAVRKGKNDAWKKFVKELTEYEERGIMCKSTGRLV